MKTNMKKFMRLGVAGLFAFSLGLAPTLVGLSSAHADVQPPQTIDASKKGTITIHKYLTDAPSTTPATGNPTDAGSLPAGAKPLQNVKFKIEKVTLAHPINTLAGMKDAAAATVTSPVEAPAVEVTTGSDGTIASGALDLGLYRVTELDSPDASPLDGKTLVPAAPFLVMLPMTNPANNNAWNYDVHVFPKNQANGALKTVSDKDVQAGGKITWTISADVPAVAKDKKLAKMEIADDIDEDKVNVTEGDIKVQLQKGSEAPTDINAANYTLTLDPSTLALSIKFNDPAGLAALQALTGGASGYKVVVTIPATVKTVGTTDGKLLNKATVVTNNGGGGGDVTTTTNETHTYYGKLKIHKKDDKGQPLNGATFQLYYCDGTTNKVKGSPLTVDGKDTWTTEGEGLITIDGLHVTDREDDADVLAPAQKQYCLVETAAPAGFELLPEPIAITFTSTELATTPGVELAAKSVDVENVPTTSLRLPMTGGPGILLLILAGIAIITGGTIYGIRTHKTTK